MKVIIVGHKSRLPHIERLATALGDVTIVMDHHSRGAYEGHRTALRIAADLDERCVIMEDDAIPVIDFHEKAEHWCERFPDELISFYLGTGRPVPWQEWVSDAVNTLKNKQRGYILVPNLLHGVCYSIPHRAIPNVLRRLRPAAADQAVGQAWGRPVLYPIHSLVEHQDGESVECHPDGQKRLDARKARHLANTLMEI